MPEELGAHADAARGREDVLARRLQTSAQADRAFAATVHGATQVALQSRKRLDSIEAELRAVLAHPRALALDTPPAPGSSSGSWPPRATTSTR